MVKIRYVVIAAAMVILGIWVAVYLFPSEEKKVKKQFHLLKKWASKDSGENPFTMAQKIKNITALFDSNCEMIANQYSFSGSYTPEELSGYTARARLPFSQLSLNFYDLKMAFPEKRMAKVSLTARITGKLNTGEDVDETHAMALQQI